MRHSIFRGSQSEEGDYQEEDKEDSDQLEDYYDWEYNNGDYDHYQYGGQNGDQDVADHYHDGDYQWQHGIEERGESFWRSECRKWNAEEVKKYLIQKS